MTVGTGPMVRADVARAPAPASVRVPRPRRSSAPVRALIIAGSVALFLLLCWRLRGFVTDDAWISVRYAENLARGDGHVWNPGGDPVEGYSNPALVYLEALAAAVGWSALGAARALAVVAGALCIVVVALRGRDAVGPGAACVAAVLTACSAPFALWAVGGLETVPVALLLTLGVVELARPGGGRAWLAGPALAVLPWLRPEGLVVVLAVVVASEGPPLLLRRTGLRAAGPRLLWLAGLPVLSQALLELLRLGLFGHLLPNSVLYKSGTNTLDPLFVADKFLAQSVVVVVLALAGAALVGWRQRLLVVPFAVYLAGSYGTLDSANHYSRFFLPVWPQLALLAGVAVLGVTAPGRRLAGVTLTVALSGASLLYLPGNLEDVEDWQARYMTCRAGARAEMATWLREQTPPDTTVSVSDAGLLPARAGGRSFQDAFLLNDPLLQQTRPLPPAARAELVHQRRPDVVVLASREPDQLRPVYSTDAAIGRSPQMRDYRLAQVGSGGRTCNYHLLAYRR